MSNFSELDDDQLVKLLKGENPQQVFTEIYNRYWDKLYLLAYRHLKSEPSAEEIVQEIFYLLWKKRMQITIQALSLYLAAMTRYAVYKALAKEKKAKTIEANLSKKGSGASNTEEEYDQKNMLDIVKKLTNLLPQKCRMVFIQNKLLDLPLDEVAKQMNISTKTAEAHLTKALKIVRDKMKDTLTLLTIL